VEHINKLLREEPDLKGEFHEPFLQRNCIIPRFFLILFIPTNQDVLPIDPNTNEIFHAVQDGILLA